MILKSCHIDGFGILKNKDIKFDKLHQIYSENGTGKTTLADFIKVMFYDMKPDNRKKYAPYEKGAFGGSLVLEYLNDEYRIEKEFDYSSIKKDKELIYINNTLSDIKCLGKYLFNIDEDGFLKTMFINNFDLEISSPSSITFKLNNIVSKTDENFDLDKIIKSLEEEKKKYGTKSKNSIYQPKKEKYESLDEEIKKLDNLKNALSDKYNELDLKKKELEKINEDIKIADDTNLKAFYYENYINKENEIKDLENSKLKIKSKYPKIISLDRVDEINFNLSEYERLKLLNNNQILDNDFNELNEMFKNNHLNEDDISKYQEKIKELEIKKSELKNSSLTIISEDDIIKFEHFDIESDIENASFSIKKYNELNDKIISRKETNEKTFNFTLFYIISFLFIISGIILLSFSKYVIGIVLSIIGIIFIISILLIDLNLKKKNNKDPNNDMIYELRAEEKKLIDILSKYRYSDDSYYNKLNHLKMDYENYKKINNENQKIKENNLKLEEDISNLKIEIESFLNKYLNSYEEYNDALMIINSKYDRYNHNIKKEEDNKIKIEENKKDLEIILEKLTPILNEFNINLKDAKNYFIDYKDDLIKIEEKDENINKLKENNKQYLIKNNIDLAKKYEKIDLTDLTNLKDKIINDIKSAEKEIERNEDELENLPRLKSEFEVLKDELVIYKQKYKIYENTIFYIEEANSSLKKKYIAPVLNSFTEYATLLNSIFKDNIEFDEKYNFKLIRNGKLVDDYHLSQGEKTIVMLCYRLSLIKNMYDDMPFIILDDPFVNLDEKNLKLVLDLIKKISNKTQIIYFTCYDGRKF